MCETRDISLFVGQTPEMDASAFTSRCSLYALFTSHKTEGGLGVRLAKNNGSHKVPLKVTALERISLVQDAINGRANGNFPAVRIFDLGSFMKALTWHS